LNTDDDLPEDPPEERPGDRPNNQPEEAAREQPAAEPGPTDPIPGEREGPPSLDELLGGVFEETTLWPLLIVLAVSGGTLGAALIVLAFADRNPFAAAALVLLLGMTLDLGWRARSRPRLRNLARGVGLLWLSATALAGVAYWFEII